MANTTQPSDEQIIYTGIKHGFGLEHSAQLLATVRAAIEAHVLASQPTQQNVRSVALDCLRDMIKNIPIRSEYLGGQQTKYVQLDEVLGWVDELERVIPAIESETHQKPIGYLPASELSCLQSGHDASLRSAKFGPSALDGDVPVFAASQPSAQEVRE